jgi:hypothetical protein
MRREQFKQHEMGGTCNTHGEDGHEQKTGVEEREKNRPLRRQQYMGR